jgi:formylglycine-generating enzyme required for sulfatase activity
MSNIFISYRSDDAAGYAVRLFDHLSTRFGPDRALMDVIGRLPGKDLVREIEWLVGSCDVVLAVIGPRWHTTTDVNGLRRLDDPGDFVRQELTAAFARRVPVIPVLVPGATPIQRTALPRPLRKLAQIERFDLSSRYFDDDADQIVSFIEHIIHSNDPDDAVLAPKPGIKLGQARPVQLPDEPDTVLVAAGPFITGEFHVRYTATLPGFKIGKYPVTVGEFRAFIEAGGYDALDHWSKPGWRLRQQHGWTVPRYWDDPAWSGADDLPVVGVSLHEAQAYCRWTAARTDRPYRLPTETEWEKAARGVDGRKFPWGNSSRPAICNTSTGGAGHVTPVGSFSPAGDSPYGAADMSGNVAEWCLPVPSNEHCSQYPVRGGSWADSLYNSRVTRGPVYDPATRLTTIGFRVVQASPVASAR